MTATAPAPDADGPAGPSHTGPSTTEPSTGPLTTEAALEVLRRRPPVTELFQGFGPLVVALGLLVAMVLLAPSIAPERVVEVPADTTSGEEAP